MPTVFITCTCFPAYSRIPCIAIVSFGWTVYLSLLRGGEIADPTESEGLRARWVQNANNNAMRFFFKKGFY